MELQSEENIVLKNLINGDEASLKLIFNKYYRLLVVFADSFLFDLDKADDIVQSVFIKIWQNAQSISMKGSFRSYLFTAVKNKCLNELRHQKVRDKYRLRYLQATLNSLEYGYDEDETIINDLQQAIDRLPEQIRQIIRLRYWDKKGIMDIAEKLKISKNTVKTQIRRGKSRLRVTLDSSDATH